MAPSSLASSILNLIKAVIGTGMLSIPWVFGQTGLLLGCCGLAFAATIEILAMHLLANSVMHARRSTQNVTYHSLSRAAFGSSPIASSFISSCLFFCAGGVIATYLMVIGDLMPEVSEYVGLVGHPWMSRQLWIAVIGWGIEAPLCCLSNIGSLKISSIIGNVGIMYIVILIILFASGVIFLPYPTQAVSFWPPPHSPYTTVPGMVKALPIFIFAIDCSMNMPTLICELGEVSMRDVDAMIVVAVAVCVATYTLVGVCGSVAFGASVDADSLQSFPNQSGTLGGFVSIFARVAIVLNLMGGIPLFMHPLRSNFSQMVLGKASQDLWLPVRVLVTVVLFLLIWLLALVAGSLDEAMALVGGTTFMIIGYTMPAVFFLVGGNNAGALDTCVEMQGRAEGVVIAGASVWNIRTGHFKKAARVLAVTSLTLIPLLLAGQVYGIFNKH